MGRIDPGDCPICGAAHCGCTSGRVGGDASIVLLPGRDAQLAAARLAGELPVVPLVAEAQSVEPPAELQAPILEPEPAPFTTSSYTRKEHGLKRPRRG
jgi:hypothetical protein